MSDNPENLAAAIQRGWENENFLARHRFIWLFVALIAFLVVMPGTQYLREHVSAEIPLVVDTVLFSAVLTTVVLSVHRTRAWKALTLVLGMPAALFWLVPGEMLSDSARVVRHLFAIAFLVYAIVSILHLVFVTRQVNSNVLFASLCVYLLLGVAWAIAYSMIEILNPTAFYSTLPEGKFPATLRMDAGNTTEALYFSFTTLTTLGFGDILPSARVTRLLAAMEALVGQLYLTVLVARLVGLHIADMGSDGSGVRDQESGVKNQ